MLFKKILVPLDGSELAERALEPAITLAEQVDGEVILLSVPVLKHLFVAEPTGYGLFLPEDSIRECQQELETYLSGVRNRWEHPNLRLRTEVVNGDEASVIVDTASEKGVDLIVMSTHGRSGLSRWVMGSITERVLHEAPCPVLVIRHAEPILKTLITLDGSDLSEQALGPGLEVARLLGTQVTLMRVEQPMDVDPVWVGELEMAEQGLGERMREDVHHGLQDYLSYRAQRYSPQLGETIESVVASGPVAQAILDYAELHDIDLVVMATHGRSGLSRWVYGSVTEKVLRHSKGAVLVIRPFHRGNQS